MVELPGCQSQNCITHCTEHQSEAVLFLLEYNVAFGPPYMEITVAFSRFFKNIRFNWLKMKYQINVLQLLLIRIHNFLANYGAIFFYHNSILCI